MVNLVCDFSCTEQIVSLLEETVLPEKLSISDCLDLISINSGRCSVSGGSKMNIVSGICDNCKSTQLQSTEDEAQKLSLVSILFP
jgi:hypothetical protein